MTAPRTEFGFDRTSCDCQLCRVFCRHYPAFLIPADLPRLIPHGQDPRAWAREHLRVRVRRGKRSQGGTPIPELLLPAMSQDGVCHWYQGHHCAVHAEAPFGCAFFDQHQSDRQAQKRADKAAEAIERAMADPDSLYRQLCDYLVAERLWVEYAAIARAEMAAHRELDRLMQTDRNPPRRGNRR